MQALITVMGRYFSGATSLENSTGSTIVSVSLGGVVCQVVNSHVWATCWKRNPFMFAANHFSYWFNSTMVLSGDNLAGRWYGFVSSRSICTGYSRPQYWGKNNLKIENVSDLFCIKLLIEQVSEKISGTLLAASIGPQFQTSSDRVFRSGTATRAFAAPGFLVAGCGFPVYLSQLFSHFNDSCLLLVSRSNKAEGWKYLFCSICRCWIFSGTNQASFKF